MATSKDVALNLDLFYYKIRVNHIKVQSLSNAEIVTSSAHDFALKVHERQGDIPQVIGRTVIWYPRQYLQ